MAAPVNTPQKTSIIHDSAAPLTPPKGSMTPLNAAAPSVVGLPSASSARPGGIASPRCAANFNLPRATVDIAISTRNGGPSPVGAPKAKGLVPKKAFRAPQGGRAGEALVNTSPMQPASIACYA